MNRFYRFDGWNQQKIGREGFARKPAAGSKPTFRRTASLGWAGVIHE
jgi:hypothetical protein